MPSGVPIPGWLDVLDIALVAGFVWLAIRYFRQAHARAALAGLALLGVVYLFARGLELRLAAALLQGFFAVLVLVLVVVFQEDLRRVFEQLGSWWQGRPLAEAETEVLDLLVRSVAHLASNRTGALLVLPGQEPVERHIEGGIAIDGRVSEPLLLSLFDPNSPGHDGAVLLRGARVERFAVHLPLSADHDALGPGGTRHAAALGLAERCDATCIVVSEERGVVSIARQGEIRPLARPEDLAAELRSLFERKPPGAPWWRERGALDAVLAAAATGVLWTLFVLGSDVGETTLRAGVEVTNLPDDLRLESIRPDAVEVTLRGPWRHLLLARRDDVSVRVDAYLARFGRRTFTLSAQEVRKPDALSVVAVRPEKLRLSFDAPAGP